ncbi:hypothetical protein [Propionigenium maris]|uniref:hypothetical protein n=1 Tax=Propionigenium maris TaxID=45622 RepID=UPI00248F82D5|nr:hypothetical protein [Propionigenium maris]
MAVDVVAESVSVMKRREDRDIFEEPLKEVLERYPEIGEFLRERGVGCEGCPLFHLANLREVFSCYKLSREEFHKILLKIEI